MKYSEMTDQELFTKALDVAGYIDVEPTEQSVRDCFIDYACCGVWENIDMDFETDTPTPYLDDGCGNEELTPRLMAINLIKLGNRAGGNIKR